MYRNHSLDLNPFTIAFREALQEERSRNNGVSETTDYINGNPARRVGSDISPVLEMILSGKGFEVSLRYANAHNLILQLACRIFSRSFGQTVAVC